MTHQGVHGRVGQIGRVRPRLRHFCHRGYGKLAGLIAPRGDTQVLKDSGLMAVECSVGVDHAGFAFNTEFLGHMLNARCGNIFYWQKTTHGLKDPQLHQQRHLR